jgi:hypothetical protein
MWRAWAHYLRVRTAGSGIWRRGRNGRTFSKWRVRIVEVDYATAIFLLNVAG